MAPFTGIEFHRYNPAYNQIRSLAKIGIHFAFRLHSKNIQIKLRMLKIEIYHC